MPLIHITDPWPEPQMETGNHWVDVVGYEGLYQVSKLGNVRSVGTKKGRDTNGTMSAFTTKTGYFRVSFYKDKTEIKYPLHRLVALAFIPNPENKGTVNHINGIKTDNRSKNLEWNTITENVQHSIKTGLRKMKGDDSVLSKITSTQVIAIRADRDAGMKPIEIVRKHGTPYHATHKVIQNKNWKHLIK